MRVLTLTRHCRVRPRGNKMALLPKKDLIYWYREFRSLLSGWTIEQQIQYHEYCVEQLKKQAKGGLK